MALGHAAVPGPEGALPLPGTCRGSGLAGRILGNPKFCLLRTAPKDRLPPPTASRQPPPTATNRQSLFNTVSVVFCLAHLLTP